MALVGRSFLEGGDDELQRVARVILDKKSDMGMAGLALAAILQENTALKKEGGRLLRGWADGGALAVLQAIMELRDPVVHPYLMAALKRAGG